jgi:4-alpha-methyl-delta7-sterol-4alpha-methyl oxidase
MVINFLIVCIFQKASLEQLGIPDIGKFLYKNIHSLHHKSYNPTAFSGTSMHAIEAITYFSAAIQPVIMGNLHPVIPLAWIMSLALDAWLGHDGFQVICLLE